MDENLISQQLKMAFDRRDYGRALQMATQLNQTHPLNLYALQVLAQIKLVQGLWSEAGRFAEQADQLEQENAMTLSILARVYGARGMTDRAIEYSDRAIKQDPTFDAARRTKAQFLERAGRADEALVLLDSIEDKNGLAAFHGRCLLSSGDVDGAIEMTATAAKEAMPNSKLRYNLMKIKAKALDKAGRYEEAYAALRECNATVRPKGFSISRFEMMIDQLIAGFSKENLSKYQVASTPARRHVIIAGMPRSGTTLVEQILDAHPDVSGMGEVKELDIYTRRLQQTLGLQVPYPACLDIVTSDQFTGIAKDYEQALVEYGDDDLAVAVNKNLHNIIHLGFISLLLPNAKVIFTQRDPRDITISCLMGTFRPEMHPYLFEASDVMGACEHMQRLMDHWLTVLDVEMTTVRYENLVSDQEAESKRLVEFCGLPWDDRCLRFWESDRTVMTLAYDQVTKPMYNSSVGRWKNYEGMIPS